MKTCLLLYGVAVALALAQPVTENETQRLIRLSDIIVKGEVIRTEEQKVIAITPASEGVSYVRPDRCLKGDPVKTEVTLMDNMPVVVRYRKLPAVRVGWWRETPTAERPCTLNETKIWFLHLQPGSTNTYSIVGKQDISAEQKIVEQLETKQ